MATSDADKADILNEAFVSVGTLDNGILPSLTNSLSVITISTVYFHHFEILKCICKLRKYSSAGPDGLPLLL